MEFKNSMMGDYSPTPASPQAAVDNSKDTDSMLAGLGTVPGFDDTANTKVEGDVGGARAQS